MIKPCEGKNVWIHDCTVWNQDDCIAVKVLLILMLNNYQKILVFMLTTKKRNNLPKEINFSEFI